MTNEDYKDPSLICDEELIAQVMLSVGRQFQIEIDFPFRYFKFDADPRMKTLNFWRGIHVLQALENMRSGVILFETVITGPQVLQLLNYTHPNLKLISLQRMTEYLYRW